MRKATSCHKTARGKITNQACDGMQVFMKSSHEVKVVWLADESPGGEVQITISKVHMFKP